MRRGLLVLVFTIAAATLAGATAIYASGQVLPGMARSVADVPPLPYRGPAGQLITVTATSPQATTATLSGWRRTLTGWVRAFGPFAAHVGAQGIGRASESTSHTPAGTFPLTESFGNLADPGTRLPYRRVDRNDWWVSDVHSPAYNTHQRCRPGHCPFDESAGEDIGTAGAVYDHAVVIDYNRHPAVPGAGSAFFLHVTDGTATAGCVAVPRRDLVTILRWLNPAARPVIAIGLR